MKKQIFGFIVMFLFGALLSFAVLRNYYEKKVDSTGARYYEFGKVDSDFRTTTRFVVAGYLNIHGDDFSRLGNLFAVRCRNKYVKFHSVPDTLMVFTKEIKDYIDPRP